MGHWLMVFAGLVLLAAPAAAELKDAPPSAPDAEATDAAPAPELKDAPPAPEGAGSRRGVEMGALPVLTVTEDPAAPVGGDIVCPPDLVCVDSATGLPLRGLPRPHAHLYHQPQADPAQVARENLTAFQPVFVYDRRDLDFSDPAEPAGWYQVGGTLQGPDGWMAARDLMEWRHALVAAYTHPGVGEAARRPVLMFADPDTVWTLLEDDDRAARLADLADRIAAGESPAAVVSTEPTAFVDIEDRFYLLPVLDHQRVDLFDEEGRLVEVAAAVPGQRSAPETRTTLDNEDYRRQATGPVVLSRSVAPQLKVDIVFVMDLTGSMGPYLERTKRAITDIARTIASDPAVKANVHYGLVGYRDSVAAAPQLEFTVRNFTPRLLDDMTFIDRVQREVTVSGLSPDDWTEEPFAGIAAAVGTVEWNDGLNFVILVGDAGSHPPGHPQSATGMDAAELRHLLDRENISVFALLLDNPQAGADRAQARRQFAILADNPGVGQPALQVIDAAAHGDYHRAVNRIAAGLVDLIRQARQGQVVTPGAVAGGMPPPQPAAMAPPQPAAMAPPQPLAPAPAPATLPPAAEAPPQPLAPASESPALAGVYDPVPAAIQPSEPAADPELDAEIGRMVNETAAAALVNYLGGEPVRDIRVWAYDHDLAEPWKESLGVRVLVTRRQLNDLIGALGQVIEAMATAEFTGMTFFESLQAILSQVATGQNADLARAETLQDSGVVPAWIASLPYRSTILDMSDALFESLSPDERAEMERALQAKYNLYVDLNGNLDKWVQLDPRAATDEWVYPLPLNMLP